MVAITFDDGYRDVAHNGIPILEKHALPASLFVLAGREASRRMWFDELERAYFECGPAGARHDLVKEGIDPVVAFFRHASVFRGKHALEALDDIYGLWPDLAVTEPKHEMMTTSDLLALASRSGVSIETHGVTHTATSVLSEGELRQEVASSAVHIRELTGRFPTHFAYPFGTPNTVHSQAGKILAQQGMRSALTTDQSGVDRGSDPYRMPRRLVRNWGAGDFHDWLMAPRFVRWLDTSDQDTRERLSSVLGGPSCA
ncbi:polysaccharide deacetylase family protein [Specibacter sp. NPDC078709]|uniref:polysaccharide deacetylase family protein n=1 Tax=Specibacter sp. NPDC078709 TaxID=3154364 RepID=UPI003418DE88